MNTLIQKLLVFSFLLASIFCKAIKVSHNERHLAFRQDTLSGQEIVETKDKELLECQNPSVKEMNKILAKMYEVNIDGIVQGIEYFMPLQSKYNDSLITINIPAEHTFEVHGETTCLRTKQTKWDEIKRISTCPHYFVAVQREDMFPYTRLHAKCSCDRCIHSNDTQNFRCQPVYVALPVLKRGKCNPNGQFEWKPMLERVSLTCSCLEYVHLN